MDRLCIWNCRIFLGRSSTKPSGAQSGKEVSYDYTDTLGFVCSSTSRFNEPHGAAPPQGSVGPLLQSGLSMPNGATFASGHCVFSAFSTSGLCRPHSVVLPLGSVGPVVLLCLSFKWVLMYSSTSGPYCAAPPLGSVSPGQFKM